MQLFGGYGYVNEYEIARIWRDSRVQRVFGGTSEIMQEIIGRSLGLYVRRSSECPELIDYLG